MAVLAKSEITKMIKSRNLGITPFELSQEEQKRFAPYLKAILGK